MQEMNTVYIVCIHTGFYNLNLNSNKCLVKKSLYFGMCLLVIKFVTYPRASNLCSCVYGDVDVESKDYL